MDVDSHFHEYLLPILRTFEFDRYISVCVMLEKSERKKMKCQRKKGNGEGHTRQGVIAQAQLDLLARRIELTELMR